MANLSKLKRDQMIAFLEKLKEEHSDDASIKAFNEIENHIRDKKYGLVWEEHSEQVDDLLKDNIPILTVDSDRRICKDSSLPWNFIVEGDNLQALYLLQKTHKGKVDCIYIDPPYNTGARDWKYNNDYVDGTDVYRHSKWLSMMKNRLLLAKDLLNPADSVLICTIDEKEYLHLGCMLEELFPEARMQMIATQITPQGNPRVKQFYRTDEYIFILEFGDAQPVSLPLDSFWRTGVADSNSSTATTTKSKIKTINWVSLLRTGSARKREDRPMMFYPFFIRNTSEGPIIDSIGDAFLGDDIRSVIPNDGTTVVWPIGNDGELRRWQVAPSSARLLLQKGYLRLGKWNADNTAVQYLAETNRKNIDSGLIPVTGRRYDGSIIVDENYIPTFIPGSIWKIPSHDATRFGSQLLSKVLGDKRFNFPKSLYAVHDTIRFFVANKPNAIIIDFFAGSGTTLHAVNLLNAEDGGSRTCIMATNNEVSVEEAKRLSSIGLKPGDDEWEKYGIAKYVTWPRTVCSIEGKDVAGNPIKGTYLTTSDRELNLADGFIANVKYFKCSWTPRKPEDYLLSNALCLHIKEMIELQNAIEVDNIKNVLILNKEDFRRTILNPEVRPQIERVWVNQNIIFSTEELKALKEIGYKYIPREFFGQELREAAE